MRPIARRLLLPCVLLLPCLPGTALAQEHERSYTGIAFTYTFGGGARDAAQGGVSFGTLRSSVDVLQEPTVLHVPLLQVPLAQDAYAVLAPLQAVMKTLGLFRARGRVASPPVEQACVSRLCTALPDLDAR